MKAYYDWQLLNMECMVQKAMGVERQASKVFTKVLPIIEYYTCADFELVKLHVRDDLKN